MTQLELFGAIQHISEGPKMSLGGPKTLDFDLQNDHFGPKIDFLQKCSGSPPKCSKVVLRHFKVPRDLNRHRPKTGAVPVAITDIERASERGPDSFVDGPEGAVDNEIIKGQI